jgi:CubicO group peptidase (beta-lactamase class C family)
MPRLRLPYMIVPAALVTAWVVAQPLVAGQRPHAYPPVIEQRIARVENNLLPPVVLKGDVTTPAMRLADRMVRYGVPGISVAVINHGAVEWIRHYGVIEAGGHQPITDKTRFQAGSVSKPVTALAALRLVDRGLLDLDEDVNVKLKSWKVPENEFTAKQKVTLRLLLSHGAGITVPSFWGYGTTDKVPTVLQVLEGVPPVTTAPVRVDMVPGTKWRYAGGGYLIIQQLLTDVTGLPFPELMRQEVLAPLGMTNSTFEQPLPPALMPFAATGHRPDGTIEPGKWRTYPEMAAAGLWTTAADLTRVVMALQQMRAGTLTTFLRPKTIDAVFTRQTEQWGLVMRLLEDGGVARFVQPGVNKGFAATVSGDRDNGQGIVTVTNGYAGGDLAGEVSRGIQREYGWTGMAWQKNERTVVKVAPTVYAAYAGRYQSPDAIVTIRHDNGHLVASVPGQPDMQLYPESETTYLTVELSIPQFTFVKDDQGRASAVVLKRSHGNVTAKRLVP